MKFQDIEQDLHAVKSDLQRPSQKSEMSLGAKSGQPQQEAPDKKVQDDMLALNDRVDALEELLLDYQGKALGQEIQRQGIEKEQ